MKEIMNIFDIQTIPHQGIVIGGTNTALDTLSREKIRALIGKLIMIRTSKRIFSAKVIDVDITTSLTGKKNIFILLPAKDLKRRNLAKYLQRKNGAIEKHTVVFS
jgi:hypothetical protein